MDTFAGKYVAFVYGDAVPDTGDDIGLVFTGKEVADAIPGFQRRTQGYIGLVDASPSVVVQPAKPNSNFDEILARSLMEMDSTAELTPFGESGLYRPVNDEKTFVLSDKDGGWQRADLLPPHCRISNTQDGGTYESCLFTLRREGLEYSFSIKGENIAFADKFVDFVQSRLSDWQVAD